MRRHQFVRNSIWQACKTIRHKDIAGSGHGRNHCGERSGNGEERNPGHVDEKRVEVVAGVDAERDMRTENRKFRRAGNLDAASAVGCQNVRRMQAVGGERWRPRLQGEEEVAGLETTVRPVDRRREEVQPVEVIIRVSDRRRRWRDIEPQQFFIRPEEVISGRIDEVGEEVVAQRFRRIGNSVGRGPAEGADSELEIDHACRWRQMGEAGTHRIDGEMPQHGDRRHSQYGLAAGRDVYRDIGVAIRNGIDVIAPNKPQSRPDDIVAVQAFEVGGP